MYKHFDCFFTIVLLGLSAPAWAKIKSSHPSQSACSAADLSARPLPKSCVDMPELTINTTAEPPYTNSNQNGFLDVIGAEMFRRAGYRLKIVTYPAERALVLANDAEIDGDFVRITGLEKQYPNLVRVQEKLIDWKFSAFVKSDKSIKPNYKEFRKHRTGIIRGWKIYEAKMAGAPNLVVVSNSGQLFNLLQLGKIDVALYSLTNGRHIFEALNLKDIKMLSPPMETRPMYTYLNKKLAHLLPKLKKALRDIKAEGFYNKVYQQTVLVSE